MDCQGSVEVDVDGGVCGLTREQLLQNLVDKQSDPRPGLQGVGQTHDASMSKETKRVNCGRDVGDCGPDPLRTGFFFKLS